MAAVIMTFPMVNLRTPSLLRDPSVGRIPSNSLRPQGVLLVEVNTLPVANAAMILPQVSVKDVVLVRPPLHCSFPARS